jgi:arylsulfatase A-like enzyme
MYQHKAPHRNWQPGPKHLTKYDDVEIPEPPTLFDDYQNRADPAREQKMSIEKDLNDRDLKLASQKGLTPAQREKWDAAYGPKNAAFKKMQLTGKELVKWKYQRYVKDYLRCVDSVDENVGRVLDRLDELKLAENTIVIYTSDQGWYLGDHGWFDKRWMYEESFRTPLLVRWPKNIKAGSVCNSMAMNLDFAPTFLEAAGAEIPGDMQGASLVPLAMGKEPVDWRTAMYYHYYEFPGAHSVARHYGVRTDRYKLIHYYPHERRPDMNQWELFDLESDPNELQNLYGKPEHAELTKELKQRLEDLRTKYKDDGTVVDNQPKKKKRKKAA